MDFSTYWHDLVHRVYGIPKDAGSADARRRAFEAARERKDLLRGPEEIVYRLTMIYGETMSGGIVFYFDQRFDEYDKDVAALIENGFADIAADFAEARQVIFGDSPLSEAAVTTVLDGLLNEGEAHESEWRQIDAIKRRLIERLPRVLDRRDEIGVANGLFTVGGEPNAAPDAGRA